MACAGFLQLAVSKRCRATPSRRLAASRTCRNAAEAPGCLKNLSQRGRGARLPLKKLPSGAVAAAGCLKTPSVTRSWRLAASKSCRAARGATGCLEARCGSYHGAASCLGSRRSRLESSQLPANALLVSVGRSRLQSTSLPSSPRATCRPEALFGCPVRSLRIGYPPLAWRRLTVIWGSQRRSHNSASVRRTRFAANLEPKGRGAMRRAVGVSRRGLVGRRRKSAPHGEGRLR